MLHSRQRFIRLDLMVAGFEREGAHEGKRYVHDRCECTIVNQSHQCNVNFERLIEEAESGLHQQLVSGDGLSGQTEYGSAQAITDHCGDRLLPQKMDESEKRFPFGGSRFEAYGFRHGEQ